MPQEQQIRESEEACDWDPLRTLLLSSLLIVLFGLTGDIDGFPAIIFAPFALAVGSAVSLGITDLLGRILVVPRINAWWYNNPRIALITIVVGSLLLIINLVRLFTRDSSSIPETHLLRHPPNAFDIALMIAGLVAYFPLLFAVAYRPQQLSEEYAYSSANDASR